MPSVPDPSFVTISVAPRTSTQIVTSRMPIARWTGTGALLQGYCVTADFTMIDGPTAYWVPVLGCANEKPDCCPFDIPPTVSAAQATAVETELASGGAGLASAAGSSYGFPSALSPVQATLSKCPDDYHSIDDACCPS